MTSFFFFLVLALKIFIFMGELFEMHLNGNTFKQYFNFGMATINGFMTKTYFTCNIHG